MIYRQFLKYLRDYSQGNKWYVFIDPSMDAPNIDGVEYIHETNHSWKHRIYWDSKGFGKWLKDRKMNPDVVVSLQNTGVRLPLRQVIYYHQPLPFFRYSWNPFRNDERYLFLIKHFYPLFVGRTLNKTTDVVVQTEFIKRCFVSAFKMPESKVHVLPPDIESVDVNSVVPANVDGNFCHFVYPATPYKYKNHRAIVEALALLGQSSSEVQSKIKVHFTFTKDEYPELSRLIEQKGVEEQFVLHGRMKHEELLSIYKSSSGLLFPSTIETVGLPLLEAAAFGMPILASDMENTREVIIGYDGVDFVDADNYEAWADGIRELYLNRDKKYPPLKAKESTWKAFFELILR